jgi:hypothetical protein
MPFREAGGHHRLFGKALQGHDEARARGPRIMDRSEARPAGAGPQARAYARIGGHLVDRDRHLELRLDGPRGQQP